MATTQTIVMFLATPLLVAFTSQEAMGFSLSFAAKGARDLYLPTQSITYMQGNEEITINTRLEPYKITEMPRGGTITLQNLLEAYRISAYNNSGRTQIWNFTKADKDLRGNVEVLNYYACTFKIPCKYPNLPNVTTPNPPVSTGVGAGIELNYRRGRGDTTRDLRWIQWVNTNHPAHVKEHDNKVSKYLDNVGRENTPFYPGSTERLTDRSYRDDPLNEHYWFAEAYLADIETFRRKDKNGLPTITETNVTIYNGVRWGWKNKVTRRRKQPVPAPVPVPAPTPNPIPLPIPFPSIPKIPNLGEPNFIVHPQLINSQFQGLLMGGIILSLSIFPQIIDWRIDYTATMGQIIGADVNASSIFQGQQPIGLYSHRGHAAIVLALIVITAIVGWFWRFTTTKLTVITLILTVPALLLTSTRSAILALMVASAYLLRGKYYKILVGIVPIGVIAIGIMTVTRPLDWSKPSIAQIMSSRSPMWTLSARGIKKRPLFGWGFDGFGIAYPYIRNPQVTPIVVNLDEFTYDYINIKGEISTREISTYKAHNWILDTTLSVGILGLVAGMALWGYYVCLALSLSLGGIEAVAIAYLIFTFTWFDCAQYTHIAWWTMSFAAVKSASFTRFTRFRAESGQLLITN